MSTYIQRKERALQGFGTTQRSELALPTYFATDKWNRHHYDPNLTVAPQHNIYAPCHLHANKQVGCKPNYKMVPPRSTALAPASDIGPWDIPYGHYQYESRLNHEVPQPTREFGLHLISLRDRVYERAPDNSKYTIPHAGQIGSMFHREDQE